MAKKSPALKQRRLETPQSPAIRKEDLAEEKRSPASRQSKDNFPIAAIGASAGGIEAFSELMRTLPADTGMAFVLIQHLDPKHHSILTDLIAKDTTMPVVEVTDGMKIEPNHVYVIPPNATMSVSGTSLRLRPREEGRAQHLSIDHFMRSLAEEQGSRAVGVVLSGSGSDGTLGMAEIQAQGGFTFAQDKSTAKYEAMPRSAITAGCVDYVLPPLGIARELARLARHEYVGRGPGAEAAELVPTDQTGLSTIFQLLRRTTGVDFTYYRKSTILRRIQRRMLVHKIDKMSDYVKRVQSNPVEIKALYQDMLINVTSFFRNPRVFDALKAQVFPQILKNHPPDTAIRVWTVGCASGEETYSLAIALLEALDDRSSHLPLQFFGTDVSETSITKARAGFYPENILSDVSPERLRRYFMKVEGGYRISKLIRDMCIFAQHNVCNDPPFSQMDIISCRNLLIYLEPVLQNRVISLFHYATRPGGYLVLGTSEGAGTSSHLFSTEDRAHRIFSKKSNVARPVVAFSLNPERHQEFKPSRQAVKPREQGWNYVEAQKEFDRKLLNQYSTPTVFLNRDLEIVHTRGAVNRYLKVPTGRVSLSILKMAREGLLFDLRKTIARAQKENKMARKAHVEIKVGNGNGGSHEIRRVALEVTPFEIPSVQEGYLMVAFLEELPEPERKAAKKRPERFAMEAMRRITKLEDELSSTKEYLQSVTETQEATNEELQSANEEILSSNEELQSANEELETAKEELQSANEELTTVNDELRSRNLEVTQGNNDLTNLLSSINIAVVIVSSDLTIRRFTAQAQPLFGLIPSDVGRPLLNINPAVEIPDFQKMVVQVMAEFRTTEREVRDRRGNRYLLRVLPYRTQENKIEGSVMTLIPLQDGRGPDLQA